MLRKKNLGQSSLVLCHGHKAQCCRKLWLTRSAGQGWPELGDQDRRAGQAGRHWPGPPRSLDHETSSWCQVQGALSSAWGSGIFGSESWTIIPGLSARVPVVQLRQGAGAGLGLNPSSWAVGKPSSLAGRLLPAQLCSRLDLPLTLQQSWLWVWWPDPQGGGAAASWEWFGALG